MLELRPYQLEAFQALMDWMPANPKGHGILVLPCGAGKSIINAEICNFAQTFPNQRILCLTHVQELIEQNHKAFCGLVPHITAGVYCAGLKKKQLGNPVTFASIQSIHKHWDKVGFIDLVIIDEVHLVGDSEGSTYRAFLRKLWEINPLMRLVGLSATPWRLKSGMLHKGEGALFTDIVYDLPMARLIQEGWLVPMIGKQAKTQGDTSGLHVRAGEFIIREAEGVFGEIKLVEAAVNEMLVCGADRKTWLIFAVSVKHAEQVAEALCVRGIECKSVSEKTPKKEREQIIADLKSGKLRAVTNVSVLTTGTDIPGIDMVVMLRPTKSSSLFLQMAGRGLRLSPGKTNCLLLDCAGNLLEHGPITHIIPPSGDREEEEKKKGKVCPQCESVVAMAARNCQDCGYEFPLIPRKIKHSEHAHTLQPMSMAPVLSEVPRWFEVKRVSYHKHEKLDGLPTMKVIYSCPPYTFCEFICFEHEGFALQMAKSWWNARAGSGDKEIPASIDDALARISEGCLQFSSVEVRAHKTDKYPRIASHKLSVIE